MEVKSGKNYGRTSWSPLIAAVEAIESSRCTAYCPTVWTIDVVFANWVVVTACCRRHVSDLSHQRLAKARCGIQLNRHSELPTTPRKRFLQPPIVSARLSGCRSHFPAVKGQAIPP